MQAQQLNKMWHHALRSMYTFEAGGFYDVVTARVRAHFGAQSQDDSVTSKIKISPKWQSGPTLWPFNVLCLEFFGFLPLFTRPGQNCPDFWQRSVPEEC